MRLRERLIACLCAVLGAGAAVGAAACGDDERGGVEVEGATTGDGAGTVGTDTTGTGTGTAEGATAPDAPDTSTTETAK